MESKKITIELDNELYELIKLVYSGNKKNLSFDEFIKHIIIESFEYQFPVIGIAKEYDGAIKWDDIKRRGKTNYREPFHKKPDKD